MTTLTKRLKSEMKISDQYRVLTEEFNTFVNNIHSIDKNTIKTLISKFSSIVKFHIKNKDFFKDETRKILDCTIHPEADDASKAVIVNMVQMANPSHYKNKDAKSVKASEIMKESLRDKVGLFFTDNIVIKFVTGTDTFLVSNRFSETTIDSFKTIDNNSDIVYNENDLMDRVKIMFNNTKSISHMYS